MVRYFPQMFKRNKGCCSDQGRTEEYRHKLTGMLVLMNGMKVITDEEYLTMYKEVEKEFNTERLYGFKYLMRTEVFYADRD